MFTNTYVPQVGGVTRSVLTLSGEMQRRGHAVLVVAPAYDGHTRDEPGVLRVPAIRHLTGSDYAMPIPMSRHIRDEIEAFGPDIIHVHHPFLLGDTGLRTAASLDVPSVYTCHTRYDHYLGAAAAPDGRLARLVRRLTSGFADIADAVIAPSESIRAMLVESGVTSPIRVIPTGIDLARMRAGDGAAMRTRLGLAPDRFVVGHLGRLSPEKNLAYLGEAVALFLARHPDAHFILSGYGTETTALIARFEAAGVAARVHLQGALDPGDLASFYAAMDVFAFASLSETQGLVVTEAMAAGAPVVALDSPGVRECLRAGAGGTLLAADATTEAFAEALTAVLQLAPADRARLRRAAHGAAEGFSVGAMGSAVETLYASLIAAETGDRAQARRVWESTLAGLAAEGEILENMFHAIEVAVRRNGAGTLQ